MSEKPKINVKKRNWGITFLILVAGGILNKPIVSVIEVSDTALVLLAMFGIFFWSYLVSSLVWAVFLQPIEYTKVLIVTTIIFVILTYIGQNYA